MLRPALIFIALIVGGCDSGSQKVFDFLIGNDSSVVVLAQQPMVIARVSLDHPMMAWNMSGKIVKSDELSACASSARCRRLPVGAQVSSIDVSSEPSLAVKGVYWISERGPLEKAAPPATGGASAAPKPDYGCR
jgi:hypothetical protein